MAVLKLVPTCKDYLWGGHRLVEEYGKKYDGEVLAESWELSCHPDGPSRIANGVYAGKTLKEYIEKEGKEVLGTHCRRFRDFPILIKFIDAKDNLSIQVHPDNRYALKNEGQYGKTEMWYVMDAGKEAFLYYGFKQEVSLGEFEKRIKEDTLLEVLNAVPVKKGDVLFIESGTIHAIGKDILIAEIQQNSNVTYRVYDYGRVGKDGQKRDLHIEKALAVTNRVPILKDGSSYPHVADCDYFTVDKLNLDGKVMRGMEGYASEESFVSILVLDGKGFITSEGEKLEFTKGDSLFISAGSGEYRITGTCDALVTTIREKAGPVRIGVSIGVSVTKIGLLDIHQKILSSEVFPTRAERPVSEVIEDISKHVLALLEKQGITLDQCVGIGIAVPGTIDRKHQVVLYSNNIHWEDVELAKEIGNYLPIPVQIANDADCAAWGEYIAGAGKDAQDIVLLTLGTGVGSGIVMDGRIYGGQGIGGSEFGHVVMEENGELCTCGRRGCLEAYVSVPALKRQVQAAVGKELSVEEIFSEEMLQDEKIRQVLDRYVDRLGIGVVNIVNIIRPQLVLIGGTMSEQANYFLPKLRENVQKNCFGGLKGELPEIKAAALGEDAAMIGAACI